MSKFCSLIYISLIFREKKNSNNLIRFKVDEHTAHISWGLTRANKFRLQSSGALNFVNSDLKFHENTKDKVS